MSSETTMVAAHCRIQEWAAQIRDCQSRPAGMDRLAALVEAQTENRPYVPDTLYLFCGKRTDRIKGLVGRGMDDSCYIRGFPKATSNGPAARRRRGC